MAKADPKKIDNVYSHLVVNKTKRATITSLTLIIGVGIGSFIFANLLFGSHWGVIALPVCLVCLILTLAPISEEWNYKPWQKSPRRMEHHNNEW